MTYADGSKYYPSLEEDTLEEDETTTYPNRIPTFHGYSASGSAEAEFVYVGRGQQPDFERLVSAGNICSFHGQFSQSFHRLSSESNSKARLPFPDTVDPSEGSRSRTLKTTE